MQINILRVTQQTTKVIFRNVPSEVPDSQILHLCKFYGKPESEVIREKVKLKNKNLGNVSLTSAKRFVMMKLDPGKKFNNYYWLEGPLPSDKGSRITVNHYNQS